MAIIEPTGGACGAIVRDVDLAVDLSDRLMRQLTDALYQHRCLVIKNQTLTREAYYRFAGEWGELIRHVVDYLRTPGYPEMMTIGNTEAKDRDAGVRNGAVAWHTDGAYIEDPTTVTMLHAIRVPRAGGETMIADMVAAYDALDPGLKSTVDGMSARHFYGGGAVAEDEQAASPMKPEVKKATKDVAKPLILDHPVSGHRALYAVAQTPVRIEGKSEVESRDLLARLKAHATRPEFVYEHRYEAGDILIFDTLSTLHRAKSRIEAADSKEAENARLLWRLSAKGLPRVCQASAVS
jgi:taurine dioxygenase